MMTIPARNVNDAYVDGLWWLKTAGVREDSRNGKVIAAPGPVCTVYQRPWERVLFDPQRDANPFFHLMECIWMLAGSNDAKWLAQFNKQMLTYATGDKLEGAYGHRWRGHFRHPRDQLSTVINLLVQQPGTRQVVLTMWDPNKDLGSESKDVPCNTHIYFRTIEARLDMTVCCRSNDAVWGAYGANAVHFSFLHEFIAGATGYSQGKLYQFSNNFHIYEQHYHLMKDGPFMDVNPYETVRPISLEVTPDNWGKFLVDCESFVCGLLPRYSSFLRYIAVPMCNAYLAKNWSELQFMPKCDWKIAALQWVDRREHVSE